MRVYHFLNRKYGFLDLVDRSLKVARINDLNDPFELLGPSCRDPEMRRAFVSLKQIFNARLGILCFSETWQNPVQWSHYADKHKGICLGFDVPDNLLYRVSYRRMRPEPDLELLKRGNSFAIREIKKMLTVKYSHWRYEKEYRHFVPFGDFVEPQELYFQPFCKALTLREVIVGHCSSIRRRDIARALVDQPKAVEVFKARLAFRSFRVIRQRNESLWE